MDAGCGTGLYTEALLEYGVGKFTLLDVSAKMLAYARVKLRDAVNKKIVEDIVQANLPNIPFDDGSFAPMETTSAIYRFI